MLILYNLDCFTGDAEDFCIQINRCDSTYCWYLLKVDRRSQRTHEIAYLVRPYIVVSPHDKA